MTDGTQPRRPKGSRVERQFSPVSSPNLIDASIESPAEQGDPHVDLWAAHADAWHVLWNVVFSETPSDGFDAAWAGMCNAQNALLSAVGYTTYVEGCAAYTQALLQPSGGKYRQIVTFRKLLTAKAAHSVTEHHAQKIAAEPGGPTAKTQQLWASAETAWSGLLSLRDAQHSDTDVHERLEVVFTANQALIDRLGYLEYLRQADERLAENKPTS